MHQEKSRTTFLYKNLHFLNFYSLSVLSNKKPQNLPLFAFLINVLLKFFALAKSSSLYLLNYVCGSYIFFNNKKNFNILKFGYYGYLKFLVFYIFLIFKKNMYSIFSLNQQLSLEFLYLSLKLSFYNPTYLNFVKFKKIPLWFSDTEIFLKKNKLNFFRCVVNLRKNVLSQKKLFSDSFSIKFFYSFFFLWNFVLFAPNLNFFFLNSSSTSFFSYSLGIWELFFKNKVFVYKYLNISNFNYLNLNYSKLLKFRKLKYKVLKFIEDSLFSDILVRLTESVTGNKTIVSVNKSLKEQLTAHEFTKLSILKRRLQGSSQSKLWRINTRFLQNKTKSFRNFYRKSLSFFWYEMTLVCFLTYKSRDSSMLMTYIKKKMRFMNLFSHKFFLKKLWLVLKLLFVETKLLYNVCGIKIKVSGKLSVTGNSRTRTKIFKEGVISYSNMTIRVDHNFIIIKTKTGCLGFSFWLFF